MLENAIEAAETIGDSDRKIISLVIEKRENFVYINTVNYTDNTFVFDGGLPRTTKTNEEGYHGYGLKSIKNIAEKYRGGIVVDVSDGVFSLNVYLIEKSE